MTDITREAVEARVALLQSDDAAKAQAEAWLRQTDDLAAARKTIERLRQHIADIHNVHRHEFSAAIEKAFERFFNASSATAALAQANKTEEENEQ